MSKLDFGLLGVTGLTIGILTFTMWRAKPQVSKNCCFCVPAQVDVVQVVVVPLSRKLLKRLVENWQGRYESLQEALEIAVLEDFASETYEIVKALSQGLERLQEVVRFLCLLSFSLI